MISAIWIYAIYCLSTPPTGKREAANIIENFIFELSFLGSVTNIMALNGPIWYLSTMFLVMPLFIFFVRNRELSARASLIMPILFYTNTGMIYGFRSPFWDVVRSFCGMLLGTFVYEILPYVKKISDRIGKNASTIFRLGWCALPIVLSFYNAQNNWLLLFCFVIGVALCISTSPEYNRAVSNAFSFLGRVSMVLFLMQYPIIRTVQLFFNGIAQKWQAILYYSCSITTSILIAFLTYNKRNVRARHKDAKKEVPA